MSTRMVNSVTNFEKYLKTHSQKLKRNMNDVRSSRTSKIDANLISSDNHIHLIKDYKIPKHKNIRRDKNKLVSFKRMNRTQQISLTKDKSIQKMYSKPMLDMLDNENLESSSDQLHQSPNNTFKRHKCIQTVFEEDKTEKSRDFRPNSQINRKLLNIMQEDQKNHALSSKKLVNADIYRDRSQHKKRYFRFHDKLCGCITATPEIVCPSEVSPFDNNSHEVVQTGYTNLRYRHMYQ